jgi:hypothetical protein
MAAMVFFESRENEEMGSGELRSSPKTGPSEERENPAKLVA